MNNKKLIEKLLLSVKPFHEMKSTVDGMAANIGDEQKNTEAYDNAYAERVKKIKPAFEFDSRKLESAKRVSRRVSKALLAIKFQGAVRGSLRKSEAYKPDIRDGDGDGKIYDGTKWERAAPQRATAKPENRYSKESLDSQIVGWMKEHGLDPSKRWNRRKGFAKLVSKEKVAAIAKEQRESTGPADEQTARSYEAFKKHLMSQYDAVRRAGLNVYAWEGEGEPYKVDASKPWVPSSDRMRHDVAESGEFYFFMTENGFGDDGATESTEHPLLQLSPAKTSDGKPMLYNDVFRVVHDAVAHLSGGFSFSTRGEMNAMMAHATTLPEEAWPALWAETFAQNSVYELTGKYAEQNVFSTRYLGELDTLLESNQPIQKSLITFDDLADLSGEPSDSDFPLGFGHIKRQLGAGGVKRKSLSVAAWLRKQIRKANDNCGANKPGGGGFQRGNSCGKRDKQGRLFSEDEIEDSKKILLTDFSDEEIAFMYESARIAGVQQDEPGFRRLTREVNNRKLNGKTERIARQQIVNDAPQGDLNGYIDEGQVQQAQAMEVAYQEAVADESRLRDEAEAAWQKHGQDSDHPEVVRIADQGLDAMLDAGRLQRESIAYRQQVVEGILENHLPKPPAEFGSEFERAEYHRNAIEQIAQLRSRFAASPENPFSSVAMPLLGDQYELNSSQLQAVLNESPEVEQAFFGFDNTLRGAEEEEIGFTAWAGERLSFYDQKIEADYAELERLRMNVVDANQEYHDAAANRDDNVSELREARTEAMREKIAMENGIAETEGAKRLLNRRLQEYGDPVSRPLTETDHARISELMGGESRATVVSDLGEFSKWDDLPSNIQNSVRQTLEQSMVNDQGEVAFQIDQQRLMIINNRSSMTDSIQQVAEANGVATDDVWEAWSTEEGELYEALSANIDQRAGYAVTTSYENIVRRQISGMDSSELYRYGRQAGLVSNSELDQTLKEWGWKESDLATIVGAPDDAVVVVESSRNDVIGVRVEHPDILWMDRMIRRKEDGTFEMYHAQFAKNQVSAPRGFSTKILAMAVPKMQELGVTSIRTNAAWGPELSGYYNWPRNGFSQPLSTIEPYVRNKVKARFPDAQDVLDVMRTEEGRAFWREHGTDMNHAIFDLTPGSRSNEVLQRYVLEQDRNKKRRQK